VAVAAPVFAGALSVLMYALVAAVPDISLKSGFLLVGFGANLLVAGFAWIGERQRRRKRNQLGSFIQRALQLRRDCLSPDISYADTKKNCDILENEEDAYVREHFGEAGVAHLNNSHGITIVSAPQWPPNTDGYPNRPLLANWCAYRAARLSDFISGDLK
jgi:hypothetical protein